MARKNTLLVASLLGVFSVCGVTGGCAGASQGTVAAVALVTTIAATGIHRAATGDCWGRCSPGFACNSTTGFCEESECRPTCAAGYSCMTSPTGVRCETTKNSPLNYTTSSSSVTVLGTNPSPDAPTNTTNEPAPAASQLIPARASSGQVQIPRGDPGAPQANAPQAPGPTGTVADPDAANNAPLGSVRALVPPAKATTSD